MEDNIKEKFPGYEVLPLNKGWSKDRKYVLRKDQKSFTLRICQGKSLEMQKFEYETMHRIKTRHQIIRPVDYGNISEELTYILYTYLEGEDLRSVIETLTPLELYDLGLQAGLILKDIHSVSGRKDPDFNTSYNDKMTRKIKAYKESGHRILALDAHIHYLESSRDLLMDRPAVLQHGDYHLGNMIIRDRKVYIIDFNRYGFGDPYEEFDRMTLSSSFSREFAKGMLHGYFRGVPPMKFWSLLKLYVLTNAVGSIPWALSHSPDSLDFVKEMIQRTLKDYEDLSSPLPRWYQDMLHLSDKR